MALDAHAPGFNLAQIAAAQDQQLASVARQKNGTTHIKLVSVPSVGLFVFEGPPFSVICDWNPREENQEHRHF